MQISFSPDFIWIAADSDGVSVITVDRATMIPRIGSKNSHFHMAVPGGAPRDQFRSQVYFGAYDSVTNRYYFVTCTAGLYGNRHGLFYVDKPGGTVHLLAELPDTYVYQAVRFMTSGANRILYSGNLRLNITDVIQPEVNSESVASVSASYSAKASDRIVLATGGASGITVTLPAATKGRRLTIKKVDAGAGAVTVAGAGAQAIDGASTVALSAQYTRTTVVSDGTLWYVV